MFPLVSLCCRDLGVGGDRKTVCFGRPALGMCAQTGFSSPGSIQSLRSEEVLVGSPQVSPEMSHISRTTVLAQNEQVFQCLKNKNERFSEARRGPCPGRRSAQMRAHRRNVEHGTACASVVSVVTDHGD